MGLYLSRRSARVLAAALVLVLAAAGASYARARTAVDTSAVIEACRNATNGALRSVSGPQDCREGEVALAWNVTGPPVPWARPGRPASPAPG